MSFRDPSASMRSIFKPSELTMACPPLNTSPAYMESLS